MVGQQGNFQGWKDGRTTGGAAGHFQDLNFPACLILCHSFFAKIILVPALEAPATIVDKHCRDRFAHQDLVILEAIDLMVPNMDSAAVVLSRYAAAHPRTGKCWPVVSDPFICQAMYDKLCARDLFVRAGLPVPPDTPGRYPKIAKPRFGYSARGIEIVRSDADRQALATRADLREHVVEDFLLDVVETTADFYASPRKGLIGYVLRDRLEVSDGEVMVCKTRVPQPDKTELIGRVMSLAGWVGCVTLQYLTDREHRLYVIEINPRFGGGCTCAIEAGLDMPYYLMAEAMGIDFEPPARLKDLHLTRARRDFFREC